jgi:hypothetical protein
MSDVPPDEEAPSLIPRPPWGPAVSLDALGGYIEVAPGAAHPVIDRGRARISEAALNLLLKPLSASLQLKAGEAELGIEVVGVRIAAALSAAAGHTGRLRIEATGLRLMGWLPVPPHLVALALGRLHGRRGIYVDGQRSVELDLPELLAPLPVALDVRISHARLEPGWLELHCVPRGPGG